MRKLNKLLAGVSVAVLAAFQAQATCVPADCNAMGYTKSASDCEGADMIKCPFDTSKVWCIEPKPIDPEPGMILYSDGTLSWDVISGKTPVGIVAYIEGSTRLAIALEETELSWATGREDVSCLSNIYVDAETAQTDFNGASNTQCLVNYNGKYDHPAATYCNSYKPVSNGVGSDGWYLPAAGELYAISFNYEEIKRRISRLSSTELSTYSYFTSTEEIPNVSWSAPGVWTVVLQEQRLDKDYSGNPTVTPRNVRCVLAF